jgi:hypothetical protein
MITTSFRARPDKKTERTKGVSSLGSPAIPDQDPFCFRPLITVGLTLSGNV